MIHIDTEQLLSLTDACKSLPNRPHIATLYRWSKKGVRGVKLETIRIGGRTFTSSEAMQRFFDDLTNSDPNPHIVRRRQTGSRKRAEQELDDLGL